jgi:hypothetical protein
MLIWYTRERLGNKCPLKDTIMNEYSNKRDSEPLALVLSLFEVRNKYYWVENE